MLDLFQYDNDKGKAIINKPDVMLIKEFADLFEESRNLKGKKNINRAFKELQYIYLSIDWRSPYKEFLPQERHEAALVDAGMSSEEFEDPIFRAACRKYADLQKQSRLGALLDAQYGLLDRMTIYFNTLDFSLLDVNGKPIYKIKDVMAEIEKTSKVYEGLQNLQQLVKNEREEESSIRGDHQAGLFD